MIIQKIILYNKSCYNTKMIDLLKNINEIQKLSKLSINLIRNEDYIEYFNINGYDDLYKIDENEFSPVEYMMLLSNMETIKYVFHNASDDILKKIRMSEILLSSYSL
jgi:hypothetical protein